MRLDFMGEGGGWEWRLMHIHFQFPSIKAGDVETILMVPSDPSRSTFQWDMMHMDNLQHKMCMRLEW